MIFDAFTIALTSIWQYKARAALTILGIVIGISSVVMFMAVGEGLQRGVAKEVTDLGTNILFILPGEFDGASSFNPSILSGDTLKIEDVDDLAALPEVETATPISLVGGALRRGEIVAPNAFLLGSRSTFLDIYKTLSIDKGRFFTDAEDAAKQRVIVLGPAIAETLFGDTHPIGQSVAIGKESFEVVGVFKVPESSVGFGGVDYSTMTVIPTETAGELSQGVRVFRIGVVVDPELNIEQAKTTVEATLLKRHAKEDFSVLTQDDLLGALNEILDLLTAAVVGIAALSLVVAGVGIMNIMLVSVTERTREIGIRKAVGATTGAILWQFLIESIVLSVLGALIAVGLAWGGAELASRYSPLTPVVTAESVALAVGVGVIVGLVFGIAPAYRAAKLDPIVALRHD